MRLTFCRIANLDCVIAQCIESLYTLYGLRSVQDFVVNVWVREASQDHLVVAVRFSITVGCLMVLSSSRLYHTTTLRKISACPHRRRAWHKRKIVHEYQTEERSITHALPSETPQQDADAQSDRQARLKVVSCGVTGPE